MLPVLLPTHMEQGNSLGRLRPGGTFWHGARCNTIGGTKRVACYFGRRQGYRLQTKLKGSKTKDTKQDIQPSKVYIDSGVSKSAYPRAQATKMVEVLSRMSVVKRRAVEPNTPASILPRGLFSGRSMWGSSR